ncbi:MAG: hypothetical protein ABSD08_12585 [Xanthobacteraceae bacterium]|jgi:hypothetical protein
MPHTDYADPETVFPRLEARVQKVEDDAYWITIWHWKELGVRERVFNRKQAGSYEDAKETIVKHARELGAIVEPDDITVDHVE